MSNPKVLSYGGGLDSFAMLVDAIQRGELPDVVIFCDTGDSTATTNGSDPGEWPSTYRHMREVVMPLCAQHGIEFVWLDSTMYPVRNARSLFAWLDARGQIPVAGPNRICTTVAKVERFERWASDRFGTQPIEVWIGFESGEEARAEKDPNAGKSNGLRLNRFPLMERGLCRCRCESLVRDAGFPVPRKSACTFCPYASKRDWQTLARELPETFEQIEALEARKLAVPTKKSGVRLSIMGYRKAQPGPLPENPERGVHYKAPALRDFVQGVSREKRQACTVCGAAQRATKATGCDYLSEPEATVAA
jgi:hypothetical protein